MDNTVLSPTEIWQRVFDQVRRVVNAPMVWLAMQAVVPLGVDGNYFVAGLSADKQYMAPNLQTFENVTAIEDALKGIVGRILAFRLIQGETEADWQALRAKEGIPEAAPAPTHPPGAVAPSGAVAPELGAGGRSSPVAPARPARDVSKTWDELGDRLVRGYKATPYIKYAHAQARFVLEAVQYISDTMDLLMPAPGRPSDDAQERALSRLLERFSGAANLDPVFLALELFRYRQSQGK